MIPQRRSLPQVTLVCVDTRTPKLALDAMVRCRAAIDFGDAVLFGDAAAAPLVPPGIRLHPVQIADVQAYSAFVLKAMHAHVRTSHALVVQWDGFVVRPEAWEQAFLACDYIGAPWEDGGVGNGGFSLRSRALMQSVARHLHAQPGHRLHPEDEVIGRDLRPALEAEGLRFADEALAHRFSHEHGTLPSPLPFGIHGLFNLHHAMDSPSMMALLAQLPASAAFPKSVRRAVPQLIRLGRLDEAAWILDARRPVQEWRHTPWLRLRLALAHLGQRRGG